MPKSKTITVNKALRILFYNHKICTNRSNFGLLRFNNSDSIVIQEDCSIEPYSTFNGGNVFCSMGSFSYCNSPLKTNFNIGRYVSIGPGLSILGVNHPYDRFTTSPVTYWSPFVYQKAVEDLCINGQLKFERVPFNLNIHSPINIGHDVWIGEGVTLKPGITIGNGSVIAARSLVTKDIPPYSIWGGGACPSDQYAV